MPIPLSESIGLVKSIRDQNADEVAHLNDQELAELAFDQTKDERLVPAIRSNALQRGINTVSQGFEHAGQSVQHAIADENSPFPQQVLAKVVGGAVSSAPEMAAGIGAAATGGLGRAVLGSLGAGYVFGKNKQETGDTGAALGATAGYAAGLAGGAAGAHVAEKLVGPAASGLAKFAAGTVGGAVGQAPGDLLSMVSQPGGTENLSHFLGDPLEVSAYLAGQPIIGAALHLAGKAKDLRKSAAEAVKAGTPDLDSQELVSDADRLVQLTKKPKAELTELDLEEMSQLKRRLGQKDEEILSGNAKQIVGDMPDSETPATLRVQLGRIGRGGRQVVEVPAGTEVPALPDILLHLQKHEGENGNTYFYDSKLTSPAKIDEAVRTNTLGTLLGYGTPSMPLAPSGEMAVLRNRRGVEVSAVALDAANKPAVMKALGEMAAGGDVVSIEKPQDVLAWRKQNGGLKSVYSLSGEQAPQEDISFTNRILDLFENSTKTKQSGAKFKGPRFQLDENGMLNGKGLLSAIRDWAPPELMAVYKEKGIETLLGNHKVGAAQFASWLRENTPTVEAKKLTPNSGLAPANVQAAAQQHWLESHGYELRNQDGMAILYKDGVEQHSASADPVAFRRYQMFVEHGFNEASDAATGRYGVDPKPLDKMPGAVDILVRVPVTTRDPNPHYQPKGSTPELFRSHHFGESDVNVLASIRGYMETLPSGEKVFHIFEVQSDWGQRVAREKNSFDRPGVRDMMDAPDHPLLAHYETLALKTAIQHARAEGATKIAISDAETAMMTEGHDRYGWNDANREGATIPPKLPQEAGMRAAYDERLPAIAKRLTGDSSQRVDFGVHGKANSEWENDVGSPVFKGPDGKKKTNITARLYDVTNPHESVKRLFSIYDADGQMQLELDQKLQLDKLDQGLRDPAELTPQRLLERAVAGENVKMDALTNFLAAIRGKRGIIREGTFLSPGIHASMDLATHDIKWNKDLSFSLEESLTKLSHELSHGAIHDLAPEQYAALKDTSVRLGQPARLAILTELGKRFKMGDKFDPEYLSGGKFDPAHPHYADLVAHEFSAGLMEVAAKSHYLESASPEWMKFLPQPVQKVLSNFLREMKKLFSPEMPSISAMLTPEAGQHLNAIVDRLSNSVLDSEKANLRSLLDLHRSDSYSEGTFLDKLPDHRTNFNPMPRGGTGELHSFAGDVYDYAKSAVEDRYKNYFLPALWRARAKPETAGHFFALHAFRPRNKSDEHGYLSFLGQTADGKLSREQALDRWARFFNDTVIDLGSKGQKFRDAFGKIQEENQNRREASPVDLKDENLVSVQEMQEKYGLTAEQAEYARRLTKMPQLVAQEAQRKAELVDSINLTRMFYAANKTQDLEGVRQKIDRINRLNKQAGLTRFELESNAKKLEKLKSAEEPDLEAQAEAQVEIEQLTREQDRYKQLLDHTIRQEFAGAIPFRDGPDPFINRMSEFMIQLAALRARQEKITGSAGWASMSRRGRFRLRVYEDTDLGDEFARVKEYRGFQSEAEMNQYIEKNGLTSDQIEKFDMNDLKQRVKQFTPDRLRRVQEMARQQLDAAIAEVQAKTSGLDPKLAEALASAIHDIQSSYQPLENELRDVISVKGDKFGERRHNIAGYNVADFLPNTFEYMQYKTAAGNKAIAAAESDLQISRRELDNQPELRDRMKKEQQYTLSTQTEYNLAKKLVFYYYLGANYRHVIQNSVQIPLNGISQMVSDGHGLVDSYKHFGKAAKLAFDYSQKGTTGDKTIDVLLKQADKDGVSFSTAIENQPHESQDLQNVLDSINSNSDGTIGYGQRIKFSATKMVKGFEQLLQATSMAAEAANRKTTFIASILADRAKGVSEPRALYDKASQFTNFVNFVGDKPNRPGFMIEHGNAPLHGALGLMTTLQSFTLNHIGQLASFYQKGFRQGSASDRKAFYTGTAHLLAFAGASGFIGVNTAEQLFEQVTGISLRTAVREGLVSTFGEGNELAADRVADTVLDGFPALLGINAGDSIGLGSPLFRYQAGQPITAEQFGGAAVGMLGRVATGVGKVTEDPFNPQAWWDATRSAAPSFLSNAIRTYDLFNASSTLDKNQQPVSDPLGVGGSISALAGFTPQETAKQRELNSMVYKTTKKAAADYERNVLRISQLLYSAEQTGNQDYIDRARAMLDEYVTSVDKLQNRDSMINSINDQLEQNRGKVTKSASLKDSATRQRLEAAFPSVKSRYSSGVDALLGQIEVAMSLGQDDVVMRQLQSLPAAVQSKVLSDALIASGLPPAEAALFAAPGRLAHLGGTE